MTGQVNFGSHTDAVVDVVALLVNVATPGLRQGRPYTPPEGRALRTALREALSAASSRPTSPPREHAVPAFVDLANTARTVFERVQDGDLDKASRIVNTMLERYRPVPYLDRHDGEPWHLHFHGHPDTDGSGWGGGSSVALATVLGGDYADRLGVCEAPRCDRVFVDVSRNGTRRFCSAACQNRVKAAAHRARQRE